MRKEKEEMTNSIGIDIGKKKCSAAIRNNESGEILEEMVLTRDRQGMMSLIQRVEELGQPCRAVVESTSNMWIMVHDTLEEHGIDTILAHPYKTRIIAEAKVKNDRLDSRILSDLLRANMVYESYVPQKEFREKRSLIRLHASLIRMKSEMKNKIHSILEKYDYKHDFSDLFGKAGREWLRKIEVSTIDRLSIDSYLNAINSFDEQLDNIERKMAEYSFQSEDVRMLMSITGIDFFSALVISSELVDIKRFQTPWKLVSYAGLNPTSRDSSEVMRRGHITKQGSRWLRWILYECAQQTIRYDQRFKNYHERISKKRGYKHACVAVAREMLVIIWYMLTNKELYRNMNDELYQRKLEKLQKYASS